jgi:hypothetical protein
MSDLRRTFDRQGFVLVPGVLTGDEVGELRRVLTRLFGADSPWEGDGANNRADVFCRYPELRWVLARPAIVAALGDVLGPDFVYLHEMVAHDSFFARWHKDTTSPDNAGHDFGKQPDYRMVQAALYLQDNGDYGGGLDVVPGSHRLPGWRDRLAFALRERRLLAQPGPPRGVPIPSRAGDLVLFHLRMTHRASVPKTEPVPAGHRKLALFTVCGANDRHVASYMRWLRQRGSPWLKDHAYGPEMMDFAAKHGLRIAE